MAEHSGDGDRLWAQAPRLRLLMQHLAGRALRARVDREDLVQEVFVRALSAPGGLPPATEGEPALARFLNRLARNAVVDAARAARAAKRSGREVAIVRSDWSAAGLRESRVPGSTSGPSTRVAAHEEEARVLAAFEALAPDHRRVIGLRQLEGLSARETAQRMGRSETAVHSLYRRAVQAWAEGAGG